MTPEEVLAKAEEEAERQRLSKKLSDSFSAMVEIMAVLKKARVIEFSDGKPVITEAAETYISNMPYSAPILRGGLMVSEGHQARSKRRHRRPIYV